jgi:hypothetical protein
MASPILGGVNDHAEEAAMPEIKFPELRLPEFKLPEGLRDMSREDIQRAMSDVHMPDVKMPDVRLPKRSDIAKSVEQALPMRSGPSPVPFAVLAMLGGLIVGWILATSPLTAPRINAAMGGVRQKIDEWRTSTDIADDLERAPEAFRDAFRAPTTADTTTTSSVSSNGGVGVGPGRRSEKTATDSSASIGPDSVTSDRS